MAGYGTSKGTVYSRTIRISSSERDTGTSTDFFYDFGSQLQGVTMISLKYVTFFNNFDNITSDNNRFSVTTTVSGTPTTSTITLPTGRYSAFTLMETIIQELADSTGAPSFDSDIDMISNYVSFTFAPTGTVTKVVISPISGVTSPFFFLGFTSNTLTFESPTLTLTADEFAKLYGPSNVYIISKTLANGNCVDQKGVTSDVLAEIPVTAPYLGMNMWECKEDTLCEINYGRPRDIVLTDIRLADRSGKTLDLKGGSLTIDLRVWTNRI